MKPLPPEFIEKLKDVRQRVAHDAWLSLAAGFRETPDEPPGTSAAHLAAKFLNPDPCWALRQALDEHGTLSSAELATAMEVIDAWVSSSPGSLEIVWRTRHDHPVRRCGR